MHVRLINPFLAVIARYDSNATASTDGGKPGFDLTFGEPEVRVIDGERVSARVEKNDVKIAAQIEDGTWEMLKAYDNGISPETRIGIVADYQDLKRRDLVDCESGRVLFNVNDRLDRIEDMRGNLVQSVRSPGLYCVEVRPMSYGIGRVLNLVLLLFQERSRGANATS